VILLDTLWTKLPEQLKIPVRKGYHFYLSIRGSVFRAYQRRLLTRYFPSDARRLIIIFSPGYDIINGMMLSLRYLYLETKRMKDVHNSEVIMAVLPGTPNILRYTKFESDYLYPFDMILKYFKNLEYLLIHVTIGNLPSFVLNVEQYLDYLRKIPKVHINVLIQHAGTLRENFEYIEKLKNMQIGKLTATTAHMAYTTSEVREKLGFPLHWLSVWISPEQYIQKPYSEKEDLMVVSPDYHPLKGKILKTIKRECPHIRIKIIRNLPYEEYKRLISRAKWSITFGEGLDGYFVEPVFSGSISFAVYNQDFFTPDFSQLRTVYSSYNEMLGKICDDIRELDNENTYPKYWRMQYKLCHKYYDYKKYIENLKKFYRGEYIYG